uniref:peptidylprolyl isomerase n=1 Tax=Daphnia carinata TaxID=120202 RepID=A0A4Y7M4Q6_9CRUS|nr:EOG090X0971 [Daphnia carinata]
MSVILETTKGDLTVDLLIKERPKTCLNFLKLCKMKRYNFNRFHHVERNFLCQTGDPTGTGRGGESIFGLLYGQQAKYYEAEQLPVLKHTKPGLLSMVNVGDNMLGSQFFITLGDNLDFLDKEHCVFGEVVEGHDALLNINEAICDENHVPYQDIRITHTVILDDPFPDPPGLEIPIHSPEPTKEMLDSGRIAADEDINDMEGKTAEEIEELIAEKEAKARATILEMVGDLPSVDAAPPENVLFVCKLNPVTTDDDLMIIFSRFGKIVNCEIIRDRQTMNSLQYAFIEFDNPKSCEDAYFKMDNVLIDDRRIHVDFSQSVSRLQWKGKGRGVEFVGGKAFDPNKEDYKTKDQPRREQSKRMPSDDRAKRHAPQQRQRDFQPRDQYRGGREHRGDRDVRERREHREDREDRDRREHREDREDRDRREHLEDMDRREHRTDRSDFDNRGRRGERDHREDRYNRDRREERHDRDHRHQSDRRNKRDDRERRRSPDRSHKHEDKQLQCWIVFVLLIIASLGGADQISVYTNSEDAKKPVYSYQSSHNSNSRSESRHGKVTTGSYRVPLPDGRVQVVNYRADENGYVADIQYEEVAKNLDSKNEASYPASAYKAPVHIATTPPPNYEIFNSSARTNVYPTTIRNHYEVPVTTTPTPTATTSRTLDYKAPVHHHHKNPYYTELGHKGPDIVDLRDVAPTTAAPKIYWTHQTEAKYSEHNIENDPTYSRPRNPPFIAPAYVGVTYKHAIAPAYGLRYLGDLKSIREGETNVHVAPATKALHHVSEYEVPNVTTPEYEAPYRVPVNSGYAVVASPIPLAFRAFHPSKSSEDMHFSSNKDYKIYNAPTVTASSQTPATTELADSNPLYSSPAYSAPEHRSPTSTYKASTYFHPNKERVSAGYKELSRIFRETSLTGGNKNWNNFFNKAWEFARTKY